MTNSGSSDTKQLALVQLGSVSTNFFFIIGGVLETIQPRLIECTISDEEVSYTPQIAKEIADIAENEDRKAQNEEPHAWNGRLPHVVSFAKAEHQGGQTGIKLQLKTAQYYHFMAANARIHHEFKQFGTQSPTRKRLVGDFCEWQTSPPPNLVNALPVNLLLVTADNRLVFSKRSKTLAIAGGEIACAVNENLDPELDRTSQNQLSIESLVGRALTEELGIGSDGTQLCLSGLGIDVGTASYSLLGRVTIPMTFEALCQHAKREACDSFEIDELLAVPSEVNSICEFLHRNRLYNIAGVAAVAALGATGLQQAQTQLATMQAVE